VKRQKNDAADAEAICEASQRPTMRFIQIKSEAAQAAAVVFRARDLLVRQRTQIINALRGHLAEFGLVVAKGPAHLGRLLAQGQKQAAVELDSLFRLARNVSLAEEERRKAAARVLLPATPTGDPSWSRAVADSWSTANKAA
jgi:transposase